jgi:hypothetical protein
MSNGSLEREDRPPTCTAFEGARRLAAGEPRHVAERVKAFVDRHPGTNVIVFDDATATRVEFDLRGTPEEVMARLTPAPVAERGPGRPKLGVVPREVTLLPRHWDWLNAQPGGASVALRRLVEQARKASAERDRARQAQEAAYRFVSIMAGDRPNFEEASRALFAGDRERFETLTEVWPEDVRDYARGLAEAAFEGTGEKS